MSNRNKTISIELLQSGWWQIVMPGGYTEVPLLGDALDIIKREAEQITFREQAQ